MTREAGLRLALAGLATGAALALAATGAEAGGLARDRGGSIKDAPYAAPAPFRWTGFYLGAHLGYGWGDSTTTAVDNGAFDEGAGASISADPAGVIGGIQLGYNWQSGNVVFGLEADLGHMGVDDEVFIVPSPDNFISVDYGGYAVLAGRLGLAANRTLFYVKGGFAWADIKLRAGDLDGGSPDPADLTSRDKWETGWALGGGIEHALSPNWTVKAEYLYMDFGDYQTSNANNEVFATEHQLHTLKAGLNFKF